MGGGHSTISSQTELDVADREHGGSPDISMIEPVPDGLEHVVYPKYEEALRLGLEAFNQMRVNKFKRPLPHILGSIEFQRDSHAGIVPAPDVPRSSATPRQVKPEGYVRAARGTRGHRGATSAMIPPSEKDEEQQSKKRTRSTEHGNNDWKAIKQSVKLEFSAAHHSYANFETVREAPSRASSEENGVVSEADAEDAVDTTKLNPTSSVRALDGGLFDSDEAMSSALETYRQSHQVSAKSTKSVDVASSSRSHLSRTATERSQVSVTLEQLGKSINDLQQQRVAETNET